RGRWGAETTTAPAAHRGGRGRLRPILDSGPAGRRLLRHPRRNQIDEPVSVQLERRAGDEPDRRAEERAAVDEGVVLPPLARHVRAGRLRDLLDQALVEVAAQPLGAADLEVHADHPGPETSIQELLDQRLGPLPPERLDVLEPPGAQPLVVPRADVLEVDVAEDDPTDAPPHQLVQHPIQRACVVLRVGVRLDQLQPERLRLSGDQLGAHAVEADAAAHALVDVEEVADLQPLPDGAVECESGVLAAAPAQGVDHRQLLTAFRTAPTSTFWPEPTVTVAGMSRSSAKSISASVTI